MKSYLPKTELRRTYRGRLRSRAGMPHPWYYVIVSGTNPAQLRRKAHLDLMVVLDRIIIDFEMCQAHGEGLKGNARVREVFYGAQAGD